MGARVGAVMFDTVETGRGFQDAAQGAREMGRPCRLPFFGHYQILTDLDKCMGKTTHRGVLV